MYLQKDLKKSNTKYRIVILELRYTFAEQLIKYCSYELDMRKTAF